MRKPGSSGAPSLGAHECHATAQGQFRATTSPVEPSITVRVPSGDRAAEQLLAASACHVPGDCDVGSNLLRAEITTPASATAPARSIQLLWSSAKA